MQNSLFNYWLPPRGLNYEQTQKARLVHVMLLCAFAGSLVFGFANLSQGWTVESTILFLLTVISIVGVYLNRSGHHDVAAFILCFSMFLVIGGLTYYGIGLYDESVLAYPIFILCAAFLFRRRGLIIGTILSIGSVLLIYYLETVGFEVSSHYPVSTYRVSILILMFVTLGVVAWIIRSTWISSLVELRKSYDLTLQGWAKALEYRDGETAGHSRRVTELSLVVGRSLGLSAEDLKNLRRGSYLHDIGKMAIPDAILLKPGPFTDSEWEVMKQHPICSREFLADIPFLHGAIPIVYSHHERWDGTGYPEGLKGDEIPLLARIFTVVDHWDALTSDRPYRKAWPEDEVHMYLIQNSGKIFDPQIVNVFLSTLPKQDSSVQQITDIPPISTSLH